MTIIVSPAITRLIQRYQHISLLFWLKVFLILMIFIFLIISYLPLSKFLLISAYIILLCLFVSMVPLLSSMAMHYIQAGNQVNFDLARVMGAISYALGAIFLGKLLTQLDVSCLSIIFAISSIFLVLLLWHLPDVFLGTNLQTKSKPMTTIIRKYKLLFFHSYRLCIQFRRCYSTGDLSH